ncbi:MAG: phosphoribosyltransferase [Steroidobacterales bacterium]
MAATDEPFADRETAGVALGEALRKCRLTAPVVVLGLPRGGVPVAYQVAQALQAPLDVMVVRKVGAPDQPELAIGAIATGDVMVREPYASEYLAGQEAMFEQLAQRERLELARREQAYRAGLAPLALAGKTVVLVDDGVATGCTMLAAIRAARKGGAARIIAAAPVASDEAAALIGNEADETAFLNIPPYLHAISLWYRDFRQTGDDEVCKLLAQSRMSVPRGAEVINAPLRAGPAS